MFICVIRIFQQHIRRIIVHIFIRKCLQPIWLQSTFNNMNRPPSQCRASGMELLSLIPDMKQYFINNLSNAIIPAKGSMIKPTMQLLLFPFNLAIYICFKYPTEFDLKL